MLYIFLVRVYGAFFYRIKYISSRILLNSIFRTHLSHEASAARDEDAASRVELADGHVAGVVRPEALVGIWRPLLLGGKGRAVEAATAAAAAEDADADEVAPPEPAPKPGPLELP